MLKRQEYRPLGVGEEPSLCQVYPWSPKWKQREVAGWTAVEKTAVQTVEEDAGYTVNRVCYNYFHRMAVC